MGNATTSLLVTNTTQHDATLAASVPGMPPVTGRVAAGQQGQVDVRREQQGKVKAQVVVTYSNGDQIEFSFGVEQKDCSDEVVLRAQDVLYNKKPRGRLLMSVGRLNSRKRSVSAGGGGGASAAAVANLPPAIAEDDFIDSTPSMAAANSSSDVFVAAETFDTLSDTETGVAGEEEPAQASRAFSPSSSDDLPTSPSALSVGSSQGSRPQRTLSQRSTTSMTSTSSFPVMDASPGSLEDGGTGAVQLHSTWGNATSVRAPDLDDTFRIESFNRPMFYWSYVPGLEFLCQNHFCVVPGLAGKGTISFQSADQPSHYLCHLGDKLLYLQERKPHPAFDKSASFIRKRDFFKPGFDAFEAFSRATHYICHTNENKDKEHLRLVRDNRDDPKAKHRFRPALASFRLDPTDDDEVSDLAWKFYSNEKKDYVFHASPLDQTSVVVWVRTTHNACICLSPDNQARKVLYEIILGGWDNSKSAIRREQNGANIKEAATQGLVTDADFRSFWISYEYGLLRVGLGEVVDRNEFMSFTDRDPLAVSYIGFASKDTHAEWRLAYPRVTPRSPCVWEVTTPDNQKHNYLVAALTSRTLIVWVKAAHHGLICLSPEPRDHPEAIEIVLGGDENDKCRIRNGIRGDILREKTYENQLSSKVFRPFWINVEQASIVVGSGHEPFAEGTELISSDFQRRSLRFFGVCTGWGAQGQWRLTYPTAPVK